MAIEKFITAKEVAEMLSLSERAVREGSAGTHSIPRARCGRAIRFRASDIEKWMNEKLRGPVDVATLQQRSLRPNRFKA